MKSSLHNAIALRLCANCVGVVLLHLGVYLRYRRNFRWHLRFIMRNLMPSRGRKPAPGDSSPRA